MMSATPDDQPSPSDGCGGHRRYQPGGNARAREFYEARGFVGIQQTDGDNEKHEPDVRDEWRAA